MADRYPLFVQRVGRLCRDVTVTLVSGVWPGCDFDQVETRLAARPISEQAGIVGAVLVGLFTLSMLAAQAGWIGLLTFWLVVVIVAR